jgi:hypothetical protein
LRNDLRKEQVVCNTRIVGSKNIIEILDKVDKPIVFTASYSKTNSKGNEHFN